MLISEIYQSRQGEGLLTGTPSIFLRTSGCNLRCDFCDTPFASWDPEGDQLSIEQIVQTCTELAAKHDIEHAVVTGGEPMIQKQLPELINHLPFHITIETAGTVYLPVRCDLMSISPKLSNSTPSRERAGEWLEKHERTKHQPEVIAQLMREYNYQLKFVVDTPDDFAEIESYLENLEMYQADQVLLMPQGVTQDELSSRQTWLEPYCKNKGFRFSPRKHIEWYGNKRRT